MFLTPTSTLGAWLQYIGDYLSFCLVFFVTVLISAYDERVGVSRMRNFFVPLKERRINYDCLINFLKKQLQYLLCLGKLSAEFIIHWKLLVLCKLWLFINLFFFYILNIIAFSQANSKKLLPPWAKVIQVVINMKGI